MILKIGDANNKIFNFLRLYIQQGIKYYFSIKNLDNILNKKRTEILPSIREKYFNWFCAEITDSNK